MTTTDDSIGCDPNHRGLLEELLVEWEPIIRSLARKRAPFDHNGLTAEDLAQIGFLTFLLRFGDWDRQHTSHHAWMRRVIDSAMLDALRSKQQAVRLPANVWRLRTKARRTEVNLTQMLQREPTTDEIAETVRVDRDVVAELWSKAEPARSLDETRPDSDELALQLADADSSDIADKIAIRHERQNHVARLLEDLPEQTAEVVRLKWGLNTHEFELSNSEIAACFDRSAEWVRLRLREAERHIQQFGVDRTRRRNLKLSAADVETLLTTGDLAWYDLSHADFGNTELAGANMTGANLTNANLESANLTRAKLKGANLTRAKLNDANLSKGDLRLTSLAAADMVGTNLTGTDLTCATLVAANLTRAILAGTNAAFARFWRANLTSVHGHRANLTTADLTEADLRHADFSGADLADASVRRANLSGACLVGAYLRRADLVEADLTGATLSSADFTGARLAGARLPPRAKVDSYTEAAIRSRPDQTRGA